MAQKMPIFDSHPAKQTMTRFDLADLNLLLLVEQTSSPFSPPAAVPVALSAASYRLRQLEGRLGLQLFMRKPDGLEPTRQPGRIALDHAPRVAAGGADAAALAQLARPAAGGAEAGGPIPSPTVPFCRALRPVSGGFSRRQPCRWRARQPRHSQGAARDGELEIGVLDGNLDLDGLVSLPFRHDRLGCWWRSSIHWRRTPRCGFAETLACPYVGMPAERAMQRDSSRIGPY